MTTKKILFPVDFSPRCEGAIRYVDLMRRATGAEVTLLHVANLADYLFGVGEYGGYGVDELYRERMAEARKKLDAFGGLDFPAYRVLAEGDAGLRVVEYAHQKSMDLIMMPTHGRGPFRRFLLGSVTAKVLHDARCPVWTSAHIEEAPPETILGLDKIVCAVDLGPHSAEVLRWAAGLAEGRSIIVAHAVPVVEARPEKYLDREFSAHLMQMAEEELAKLQKECGTSFEALVRGGDPAHVVHDAVLEKEADLVVIGRGAATGFGRLRTHSYAIVRGAPCPVVSV
ncbi:MAG: universal stress protein [Bryobacteraceae bacterium]